MEGLFGLFEAFRKTLATLRQAAFMYCVPDVERPFTDHRPEAGGSEAVAPLPAATAETLLFGRRVDGTPKLEAALLGEAGARWKDGERARDHGKILETVA